MKRWKKAAGLCLAFALAFCQPAFAEITITPLTPETAASLNAGSGASAPQDTQDSQLQDSQNTQQIMGPGPWNSGSSQTTQGTNQQGVQGSQVTQNGSSAVGPGVPGTSGSGTAFAPSGTGGVSSGAMVTVPEVQAQAAILYDVTNKRVLYEKDARSRYYPASITKLMTALLVAENTTMDQMVTFSETATTNLEAGAVGLNVTAGDVISVKDCLYGMLLKSANEVANGLAEFVGGSISGFADMMNARAQALGCTGTHFANPNGLNNSNQYTTAYDMALIAAEAFRNPTVCQITSTVNYTFPATKKVSTARALTMGHKMINPSDARYYPGIVGGKTGYTSLAGNTLVTCAERDGLRLVVVILKSKQTHYDDTKALLDYGFETAKSGQAAGSWTQDANGWRFIRSDGSAAAGGFASIDGDTYYFDENGYMATGWKSLDGRWYYFTGSGALAKNRWMEDQGSWFYIGADGYILTNTTTPDGYQVDQNGRWVQQ